MKIDTVAKIMVYMVYIFFIMYTLLFIYCIATGKELHSEQICPPMFIFWSM